MGNCQTQPRGATEPGGKSGPSCASLLSASIQNIVHTWISHGLYEELRDVPPPIVLVLPRETNIELYKFLQNSRQRETLALTQQLQRLHVDDAGDGKQAEIGSDKHTFGGEVQTVQRDPHELENELRETREEMDKVRAELDMVRAEVEMVRAGRDAISKELTETADELSSRRARLEDLERAQAEHAQELKAVRENAASVSSITRLS
ncbi:hypothetical protein CALVIDRAFT_431714 [Calocera viscosa TUFC12733]|uniref:Uncharacterized protein n=1 Tax=Calocera viscosa (strain TUFC12733) TaxID=1330018 RepID=A0A167FZY0_CALVF|nr:hypothetical protein CALVIDRAFT_431714 [Calocera viscosa TUFC12733]